MDGLLSLRRLNGRAALYSFDRLLCETLGWRARVCDRGTAF
jgi:hypothetical protein